MAKEKTSSSRTSKIVVLSILAAIYLTILLIIFVPQVKRPAINKNENVFCYDYYDLLSSEDKKSINDFGKKFQKKYGINIYLVTCERQVAGSNYSGTYRAELWGEDFLKNKSMSTSDNCVVIIINARKYVMNYKSSGFGHPGYVKEDLPYSTDYHFDIYTYGASAKKISDNELTRIIYGKNADNILEGEEYVSSASIGMMEELGKAYSFIYTNTWPAVIAIAAIISIIITIIVLACVSKSYSKNRKIVNYSLSENTNLKLTVKEDLYSHKTVTYTIISTPSSSSSSSHSSGGIGGGGGGGGAGHRGGR